ncbi:alpha/beta hydrolase [Bacillus salinus]|uniref:alpha/beta hydrolase n=1 Tax=Bacillus sp. HMF5848 TaxID=2495421 RepID=UPI00163A67C0|nr:alpha/beta hydrolase [Bacillus sp. HMF5848]
MTLHPQVVSILRTMAEADLPAIDTLPPNVAREVFLKSFSSFDVEVPIFKVEDIEIAGYQDDIKIRVYTPDLEKNVPCLIYFHGGGWVIGNIDSHDALCRVIANESHCVVVSVDYSLAPENRFPVGLEDCYRAVEWIYSHAENLHINRNKLIVGGDSAGGNLTAAVLQLLRDRWSTHMVCGQVLIYPAVASSVTDSHRLFAEGYFLTLSEMKWFRDHYIRSESDLQNPLVAPLLQDDVSYLPPTYILTAEYDPLRDEGKAYAEKLKKAGVLVSSKQYEGMIHGFVSMFAALDDGKKAIHDIVAFMHKITKAVEM